MAQQIVDEDGNTIFVDDNGEQCFVDDFGPPGNFTQCPLGVTTNTIASSSTTAMAGAPVTFTTTLSPVGSGTPGGNVDYYDGAVRIGSVLLSGLGATFSTSSLAVGTHSITSVYMGDPNFDGSVSSILTQTITATAPAFFVRMLRLHG